jgi:excisionase family DNA binding protein
MSTPVLTQETYLSEEDGRELAEVFDFLQAHEVAGKGSVPARYLLAGAALGDQVELPAEVYRILRQVVDAMRSGSAVTVVPRSLTLTNQQGADLLGVSRPTLIKLLDGGRIPFERVGVHRRIQLRDLLVYRENAARKSTQDSGQPQQSPSNDEEDLESALANLREAPTEVLAVLTQRYGLHTAVQLIRSTY